MRLEVDVRARLGALDLSLAFASDAPVTALSGPSGCGKTSVLDMIAGLRRPDAGRILLDGAPLFDAAAGVDVPPERRGIGYVFQDARLFPHLTVRGNLRYGGRGLDEAAMRAAAEPFGIGDLLDRWPRHLSGGEARRVAILRALLRRPRLLLLDEPLAHLDAARAATVLRMVNDVVAAGTPLLHVSHNGAELAALGAQVVAMDV